MTPLATQFTFRGAAFKQLKRRGSVALYRRTQGEHVGYEVIHVQQVPEATWPNGRVTPAHEGYPGDAAFGKHGWYYMSTELDKAEARFRAESEDTHE